MDKDGREPLFVVAREEMNEDGRCDEMRRNRLELERPGLMPKNQRLIAAAKGRGLRLATYLIDWAVL